MSIDGVCGDSRGSASIDDGRTGVLAVQRAMVWLVGASGAIVFIEPSPYEIATLRGYR